MLAWKTYSVHESRSPCILTPCINVGEMSWLYELAGPKLSYSPTYILQPFVLIPGTAKSHSEGESLDICPTQKGLTAEWHLCPIYLRLQQTYYILYVNYISLILITSQDFTHGSPMSHAGIYMSNSRASRRWMGHSQERRLVLRRGRDIIILEITWKVQFSNPYRTQSTLLFGFGALSKSPCV